MTQSLPKFIPPESDPSIFDLMKIAPQDPARVIPSSIYSDWAYKMPAPGAPLVISQPEAAEQVLFDQARFGRNRQTKSLLRRAWNKGLAAAEDESWKRQRRAVGPAFRAGRLGDYTAEMAAATQRAAESWRGHDTVELQTETGRLVGEIVFNTLITGLDAPDHDKLANQTREYMRVIASFGLADTLPLSDGIIDRLRGVSAAPSGKYLRAVSAELAEKRAGGDDTIDDVISLLRGKGPLEDNIAGFMMASFETSAAGAAWAVYILACLPDLQDQVRAEVQACEHLTGQDLLDGLALTRRVVKETLRMYPPAPILARSALVKTELLGHKVSKGQPIIIDVHALHHHQQLWDAPDVFNPDRFLPDAPPRHRATNMPFSAGPRMCVAAQFAELEIMMIVVGIVAAYRLSPADPEPEVSLQISTHSSSGLSINLSPV